MKEFYLILDLVLDSSDITRLQNHPPGYLYTNQSNSLYLKHLNHLDYHPPKLVLSYGKQNHEIIDLLSMKRKKFLINHENLEEYYSVALGITDHLAMIALGDTNNTRIQIVDADQPIKVFLNTTYMEDESSFFPIPRYFTGNPKKAILVYSDNSELEIDLIDFNIGRRKTSEIDKIVKSKNVLSPYLTILGPFIIITITDEMELSHIKELEFLIRLASTSNWIALNKETVINKQLITTNDYNDVIQTREKQINQLIHILESKTNEKT